MQNVFRNLPMIAAWVMVIVLALAFSVETDRLRYDIAGLVLGLYAAYAASMTYLGVVVTANAVFFPLPIIPSFSLIVIGRKKVGVRDIVYLKPCADFSGNAAMELHEQLAWRLVFANEGERHRFVEAVHSVRSDIRVYG